ncbi:MAG: L,D-transpeptidase family protein [Nostocoides sp.]
MIRRTKVLAATAAALVVVLGGAGTAYALQNQDRALPHTSIAGMDVGGKTLAGVTDAVQAKVDRVRLTLLTPEGSKTASLADLGYTVDAAATARQVVEGRGLSTYARALVSEENLDLVVSFDPAKLRAYVDGLVAAERTHPKDAAVRLAANKESFAVVPAVTGASIDPQAIEAAAAASAHDLAPRTVQMRLRDVAPAVTTQAAQALAIKANALVTSTVKVSLAGDTFSPSKRERASWVRLQEKASGAPAVDRAKVAAWVGARADAARIAAVNGSRLLTGSGTVLQVTVNKVDGRTITNSADIVTRLTASLTANKAYQGQFASKVLPAAWHDRRIADGTQNLAYQAADGEKWIDVNLSRHTMTAYVGGTVVLGPVAMVNGAAATPSLVGTHYINRKYATDRMRGSNADGSLYDDPDVPWVSYFQGGYALHGAPWRSTFGYAASHGCINLPVSTAKWIFDWAPIGTPVVSHN